MKASEVLKAAKALIEREENWCIGNFARDKNDEPTRFDDPEACKFCARGALLRVAVHNDYGRANELLIEAVPSKLYGGVASFNDAKGHADVLKLYDKAIRLALKAEAQETTDESVGSTSEGQGTDPEPRALDPG